MNSGALNNAVIVTMNPGRDLLARGGIVWEDGRIVFVGPSDEAGRAAGDRGLRPQDLHGAVVFPGLVNTHTHLFQNLLKGLGADLNLEDWWPQTIKPAAVCIEERHARAAAAGGMLEAIRSGTTTLVDYMYALPDRGLSDVVIEQGLQTGIRLVYARGFRNTGAQHGFPVQLIEQTDDVFEDVLRLRRQYEKPDGMVRLRVAPAAIWALDGQGLRDTRGFADETGIPLTMHMYETDTDNVVCRERYGAVDALATFEEAGFLGPDLMAVHVVAVGDRELDAFSRQGVSVSHNPVANMYLASGTAPVPDMLARGMQVGLGTDGAASNNGLDMLETLKTTALLHKVTTGDPTAMTAGRVLEMATIGGARALGMDGSIGSLEVGKKADLFVLNPACHGKSCPVHHPVATLVYSCGQDAVEKVVIEGRTILDKGVFLFQDEEQVCRTQQEMAVDLVRSADYPADFLAPSEI